MRDRAPLGQERRRLRRWLALFFIALTIPTGILIRQAYSQLKWEAFRQHQVLAQELATRIDTQLSEMITTWSWRVRPKPIFCNVRHSRPTR